jgi:hypothetical protein
LVKILCQQALGESEDNKKSSVNNTAAFGLSSTFCLPGYERKLLITNQRWFMIVTGLQNII